MDTVVRTAAVGYHQPPAGTAMFDIGSHTRARVCRTRRAAGFRAVHEAATFRIVASTGSNGHLLAVLLLRFLGVLRARPKHMITWAELKLAGLNGARAAWFRLRERRGGTHRHGNRVSMSCARCSQSNYLFPEATSCIKPKTLDPLSSDTTVQAAEGLEPCAGQWKIPGTRRQSATFTLTPRRGESCARRGESCARAAACQ